jgi:hypothetical protein
MPHLGRYAPIIKSVCFLYDTKKDALAGTNAGGTGFLVATPSQQHGEPHVHAITNWHVAVYNEDGPPSPVLRINKHSGILEIFDFGPDQWIFKPGYYDVAVSPPLTVNTQVHDAVWLRVDPFFLTRDEEQKADIGIADDVFMIGRFVDYDGLETNTPAARFGHISIMNAQIKQLSGYSGRSIIIDMHSRSGFSGSPVFVYRTSGSHFFDDSVVVGGGHFIRLLGIHWGQFPEEWELKNKKKKDKNARRHKTLITNGQYVEGLSGMTCVIPAADIVEVINLPELHAMREQREKEIEKIIGNHRLRPKAESASDMKQADSSLTSDENPTHREDFTALLNAAVRKPESKD